MIKIVVTTICSAGVALAFALVVVLRGTSVQDFVGPGRDEPLRARLVEGVRLAASVAAAGVIGGILTFGLGGRLMMRVLAATSPDAQGFITDAEERVGEVTTGGTIGLVLFVGVFATMPTAFYILLRSWLPPRSLAAGLLAGGIGGGLLVRPSGLVDPANRDFDVLAPTWLAVTLCIGVVVLGSLTIAILADRWASSWVTPALTLRGLVSLLPLAVYVIPPFGVFGLLLIVSRVFVPRPDQPRRFPLATAVGTWLMSLAGMMGGAWILFSATEILT